MSDALTDIARDERREREYQSWIDCVNLYLENKATRHDVLGAARKCDSVPRGYWNGSSRLVERTDSLLDDLSLGEESAWAWLLNEAQGECRLLQASTKVFKSLLAKSAWPNKRLQYFDFSRFSQGLSELLEPYMKAAGNRTDFRGTVSGYFRYVAIFDADSTLRQMAETAVCIGRVDTGWTPGKDSSAPLSHRI